MRIALGIVKLFPEGGLQRDCVRLARILGARGHDVTIFTAEDRWPSDRQPCPIVLLPVNALTNHRTDLKFSKRFAAAIAGRFDRVVGFNKLTNLDVYYCGDPSILDRERTRFERSLPRHRVQAMLEEQCFGPLKHTHILALTKSSADSYRRLWQTPAHRITVLQPSIDPQRQRPDLRTAEHRAAVRAELGIATNRPVWLWVGAQAYVKGLDRALAALQSAPHAMLLVAGIAKGTPEAALATRALARKVRDRVRFLGFREDVADLMAAADMLVHPSRLDVTGQTILEAVVNGLPPVVTGHCGFAEHVKTSGAGVVLNEPFSAAELRGALARMADPALAETMSAAGIRYGRETAPVAGLDQAADVIEGRSTVQPIAAGLPAAAARTGGARQVPISIIVTTYNRPDALEAVLRGLERQSDRAFEVVVADDGSTPDTAAMLQSWQGRLSLIHTWQEHQGFRAAEIRNRAILASSGAYCIFLDGDCIPREDFVQEHRALAELGWFVVGNRVLMSKQLTDRTLSQHLEPERWSLADAWRARFNGDINRVAPLLQVRLGPLRKLKPQYWWGARSCNLAVWRADLDRVDGFDCSYVGWGLEDSDLLIRLLRAGVNRKDGRFATGVLHLWHPLAADASLLSANQVLLDAIQHSNRILSVGGMSSLREVAPTAPAQSEERRSKSEIAIAN
jgi:glycosyltransferase involved in cell wall biosynthesis